jgi:hypothetical protein
MPLPATFNKPPKSLPYYEQAYTSTAATATNAAIGFIVVLRTSLIERISQALEQAELEDGEPRPSAAAIFNVMQIVKQASNQKLFLFPTVSVFYGEALLTWKNGDREVSIISDGTAGDPKLLKYVAGEICYGQQQEIQTQATADNLVEAIGWLYE